METHPFHLGNPGDGNCWEITVTEGGLHIRLVPCPVGSMKVGPMPDGEPVHVSDPIGSMTAAEAGGVEEPIIVKKEG